MFNLGRVKMVQEQAAVCDIKRRGQQRRKNIELVRMQRESRVRCRTLGAFQSHRADIAAVDLDCKFGFAGTLRKPDGQIARTSGNIKKSQQRSAAAKQWRDHAPYMKINRGDAIEPRQPPQCSAMLLRI